MNDGNAWSTYWAPVINLAREPRWGRNIETPGEDPYLTGEYAAAFVTGFEHSPDDAAHLQASACCKHYAANSMEHSTEAGVPPASVLVVRKAKFWSPEKEWPPGGR